MTTCDLTISISDMGLTKEASGRFRNGVSVDEVQLVAELVALAKGFQLTALRQRLDALSPEV